MAALACTLSVLVSSLSSAHAGIMLVADWDNNPVAVGDKTFTFVSETNIGQTTASFSEPVNGFYTLELSSFKDDVGNSLTSSWTGELKYDVLVTNPSNTFSIAALDTTHVANGVDVSKTISGATFGTFKIESIDGSTAKHGISGTLIHVDEVFTIGPNGALVNATNTFTQQGPGIPTPEPGSLIVLALGLATVGIIGWRKRRQAAFA
jgi:hypothetical protein